MLLWLVMIAELSSCGAIATHGVFSQRHARELAHRWRPLPLVTDGSVTFRSRVSMQRYIRTMILLEEQPGSFGILQEGRTGLALYVVHPTMEYLTSQRVCVHTVRGVVSVDAYRHDDGLEALTTWHTELFPEVHLCFHRDVYDT